MWQGLRKTGGDLEYILLPSFSTAVCLVPSVKSSLSIPVPKVTLLCFSVRHFTNLSFPSFSPLCKHVFLVGNYAIVIFQPIFEKPLRVQRSEGKVEKSKHFFPISFFSSDN